MGYESDPRSSASPALLIAVVVVCMLVLGALVLVVLGALFFRAAVVLEPQPRPEPVVVLDEPSRRLPAAAETPADPVQPPPAAVAESEHAAETDARPAAPAPAPAPEGSLSTIAPAEVLDVRTGDQPLVRPVQVAGQVHSAAIWVQPAHDNGSCQVSYALGGNYRRLSGRAAIADAAPGEETPEAAFRIYGDGNLLWDSGVLRGGGASAAVQVELDRVQMLALVVESGSPAEVSRLAWLDMQLE